MAPDEHKHRWASLAGPVVLGALVRLALVLLGAGDWSGRRVEVASPANSLYQLREGLFLMQQMQASPYLTTSCRSPPLLLWLHRNTALHPILYVLPNIAFDTVASLLLASITRQLHHRTEPHAAGMSPGAMAALYLLNPFTVLSCTAGTSSALECMLVLLSLWAACRQQQALTAWALAAAAYVGLHPLLLIIPAALMLAHGPEDLVGPAATAGAAGDGAVGATLPGLEKDAAGSVATAQHAPSSNIEGAASRRRSLAATALSLPCMTAGWLAALAVMSDISLSASPQDMCLPCGLRLAAAALPAAVQQAAARGSEVLGLRALAAAALAGGQQHGGAASEGGAGCHCWAVPVYGLPLLVSDLTPNIGQHWYFFTMMFEPQRPFFLLALHSMAALMALPMAIRFPRRPAFLFLAQALISALLKPYPCVADLALVLCALLPLQAALLARLRSALFLANSFLLLAVLFPAMWHAWIAVESANANYLYAISLLAGAWQVVLLGQLLTLAVKADWAAKGKLVFD